MTTVTVVLVSHDGSRWLTAVLAGLARQTRPVDRVVAVDTDSGDGSAALLRERLGADAVLSGPRRASYAASVRQGLEALPRTDDEDEWVWLLHDDSNPAPTALQHLLEAAAPGIAVLGPKLREWPSLRRLLEVGVTVSGTGRRETGLERGEYDQGQHDRKRDVLAVNTAGMLVRREVLEQIGFDPKLPVFSTDLDFGWRVARAGHRTVVVPDAVVFHAEAAHRGLRRTDLTGRHFHRAERSAALYTLLVNGSAPGLPWRLLRLLVGSLLRILGFLLVRSPGEAYDELAALASTYLRPHRIIAGRRARSRTAAVSHGDVKHLLAPTWLPYRHGLDFVSDVAAAVVSQAGDVTQARRDRKAPATAETGPVDEESESLAPDTGFVARLLTNPIAGVFALLLVLAVVGMRGHVGEGLLSGGALLPAPDSVGHWWATSFSGWHDLAVGSSGPAAPYLLPLAVAGSLLLGKAWLVVDLLLLLAVPLAAWGAFRFLRRVTGSWPTALAGGVAYGLVPVLSGAVAQGRLGTVVAAILLPWLAQAASFLLDPSADRRWRAAFRSALLLFVVAAFAPVAWMLAACCAVLALVLVPAVRRHPLPLLTAVGLGAALLLPWLALTWSHHGVASVLTEAGRPASDLLGDLGPLELLTGRAGEVGSAPVALSLVVVLAAAAALVRRDTRSRVLAAWVVAVLGLGAAVLLGRVEVADPLTGVTEPLWLGLPLVLVQGAFVVVLAVAATGVRETFAGRAFGWRQPVAAALAVGVAASVLGGLGWWAATGLGDEVDRRGVTAVPAFMTDAAADDPARGTLVLRGDQAAGLRHVLLRDRGLRLGDDSAFPTAAEQAPVTDLVATLASAPTADTAGALLRAGVQYVYAPRPVDPRLAGNLDSLSGLVPASALAPGSRAWQVQGSPVGQGYAEDRSDGILPWLVGAQVLALVVTAVFAAPTRRRGRDR